MEFVYEGHGIRKKKTGGPKMVFLVLTFDAKRQQKKTLFGVSGCAGGQQGNPLLLLTSSIRFEQKTMPAVLKMHARGQQA